MKVAGNERNEGQGCKVQPKNTAGATSGGSANPLPENLSQYLPANKNARGFGSMEEEVRGMQGMCEGCGSSLNHQEVHHEEVHHPCNPSGFNRPLLTLLCSALTDDLAQSGAW